MSFFKKKTGGVEVISSTRAGECGGTDATRDTNAPKEIISDEMTFFSACSAISRGFPQREDGTPGYVNAFAVPAGGGSFLFLQKAAHVTDRRNMAHECAFVKENVFPALAKLVKECGLAKHNGFHSTTHGLPANFGGSVNVNYASGECISFSNNQTPVIDPGTALKIYGFFEEALKGERISLPDACGLIAVRFAEERGDGYTHTELTIRPDGSAVNEKESKYGGSVYTGKKEISADTVGQIKRRAAECLMFGWDALPEARYHHGRPKTLTFVFQSGKEITVTDDRELPYQISHGFFDIELELTAKG